MSGFIEGVDRGQTVLFLDRREDWIGEDSLVRVIDLFVDELDLPGLGFGRAAPAQVLSDELEQVSARTVTLSLMPRRGRATRRERRHGWP